MMRDGYVRQAASFSAPLDDLAPDEYEAHVIYSPMDTAYPGHYWVTMVRPLGNWGGCIGGRGRTPVEALRHIEHRAFCYGMLPHVPRCRRVAYYMDNTGPDALITASIAHAEAGL